MKSVEQKTGSSDKNRAPGSVALFLETHGIPVSTAKSIVYTVGMVMIVCLVAIFILWRRAQAARVDAEASKELFAARTQANLESLMERCSSSKLAPLIMLKQAQAQYTEGNYELARTTCERFLKAYPKHELGPVAELGQVFCKEAVPGNLEAALQGFADFETKYPDSFLVNEATFGHARCLEQLGRLEEARQIYEDFKVSHPTENVWQDRAETGLKIVESELNRVKGTL